MQTLHVTLVNASKKISKKTGKPYMSVGIKVKEYGDRWINGFESESTKKWAQGTVLTVGQDIFLKENGQYLNFDTPKEPPKGSGVDNAALGRIEQKIDRLEKNVMIIGNIIETRLRPVGAPMDAPPDEEVPFA